MPQSCRILLYDRTRLHDRLVRAASELQTLSPNFRNGWLWSLGAGLDGGGTQAAAALIILCRRLRATTDRLQQSAWPSVVCITFAAVVVSGKRPWQQVLAERGALQPEDLDYTMLGTQRTQIVGAQSRGIALAQLRRVRQFTQAHTIDEEGTLA